MNTTLKFETPSRLKMIALALLVIGLVMSAASFFIYSETPTRVWASLLLNNFYFLALSIGGAVIMSIGYIAHAGWNTVQKRIMEAMATYLPIGLIVMLVIAFFGMNHLYEWSIESIVAEDPILDAKKWFLNENVYIGLTAFALVVWTGMQMIIRKNSKAQDSVPGTKHFWKNYNISAGFMVIFGFSFCASIFIWLMSLEPHWYSTIYAVYVFASVLVLGFTFLNVSSIYLKGKGFLPWFNTNHMHDNSKFMFAFSIFWAYIFVSQLLLIWYANVPEETPYYLLRWGDLDPSINLKTLWWVNLVINFLAPFLVFMTRDAKRQINIVLIIAGVMFIAKWIDFYLLIMPGSVKFANHMEHLNEAAHHTHIGFGVPEVGFFLFFAGLFLYVVSASLAKANIVPKNHPYLVESLEHHV